LTGLLNGFVFLLVNALVVFSSWCLANYILKDHQSLSLRLVATGLIYFVHITIVILFLGVVIRSLNIFSVPLLSLLVSAIVIALCRAYRRPFMQTFKQCLSQTFAAGDFSLYVVTVLFALQVAVLLFKLAWFPPHIWDVFVYHLPPAVEWYQQGFIAPVLDTTVNRINGAPLGMTALAFWFFVFFRDDALVEMPMLLWALMLVPVSFAVLRQSGVSRSWALKFAVLIFFLPIVIMQAITVKDHLGLNVGFIAGLLFLAEFLKDRNYRLLYLAAAAFGLMLGYKIAAPVHIVVALPVFLVIFLSRYHSSIFERQHGKALLKAGGVSAVIAIAISGYWYLRNFIVYGRLHGAYGTRLSEAGESVANDAGAVDTALNMFANSGMFVPNLSQFFPRVLDYQNIYAADLVGISGFGPQFFAFGLLALAATVGSVFSKHLRNQPIFLLSSVAVLLFIVFMFINFNSNSYRILSFFPMVLIAYAGVLLYCSGVLEIGLARMITNMIMLLSILWCFMALLSPQYTNLLRLSEFVSLDHKSRTSANFTSWFVRPRPSLYRLMDSVPVTEPMAYVAYRDSYSAGEVESDTWQYLYMDRSWQRKTYGLHLPEYFDCEENGQCTARPALSAFLLSNQVSLLSSCKINRCLEINDDALIEIVPGLYYFLGEK
jgi:hypothetical protein